MLFVDVVFKNPDDASIRSLLEGTRRIAVVGLSPKPDRDSHRVARYLQSRGCQIGCVNEDAAERAAAAGLTVVMDRCTKVEHARLLGPSWKRA